MDEYYNFYVTGRVDMKHVIYTLSQVGGGCDRHDLS